MPIFLKAIRPGSRPYSGSKKLISSKKTSKKNQHKPTISGPSDTLDYRFRLRATDKDGKPLKNELGAPFFIGDAVHRIFPPHLTLRNYAVTALFLLQEGQLSIYGNNVNVLSKHYEGLLGIGFSENAEITWKVVEEKGGKLLAIDDGKKTYHGSTPYGFDSY